MFPDLTSCGHQQGHLYSIFIALDCPLGDRRSSEHISTSLVTFTRTVHLDCSPCALPGSSKAEFMSLSLSSRLFLMFHLGHYCTGTILCLSFACPEPDDLGIGSPSHLQFSRPPVHAVVALLLSLDLAWYPTA